MRAQVFFFTLSRAPNKASKRKAYEADQLLEHASLWQAVSVPVMHQLDAFGGISAEPRYIALLVDLFAATLQAAPISLTRFFPTLFGSAALQSSAQP